MTLSPALTCLKGDFYKIFPMMTKNALPVLGYPKKETLIIFIFRKWERTDRKSRFQLFSSLKKALHHYPASRILSWLPFVKKILPGLCRGDRSPPNRKPVQSWRSISLPRSGARQKSEFPQKNHPSPGFKRTFLLLGARRSLRSVR